MPVLPVNKTYILTMNSPYGKLWQDREMKMTIQRKQEERSKHNVDCNTECNYIDDRRNTNGAPKERKMKKLLITLIVLGLTVIAGSAFADTTTVNVSATVTGTCKFLTGGAVTYTLDPSVGTLATGSVTQPTFWCTKGTSYSIADDNGANKSGTTYRMKHATLGEYVPYTFTYTKTGSGGGKTSTITMNIASTVLGTDYINASSGSYSDIVTLTITP
jgi:spore coat protein U-like protein